MAEDVNPAKTELQRLRDEHQQISDLLALVQELTGQAIRSESVADLFALAFRTLFDCVSFDIAVAVMIEQNLDLYISTREGAPTLVSDKFIDGIRSTLAHLIPVSFETTEIVVKSEHNDLAAAAVNGDSLAHAMHAILLLEHRTAGVLVLYRAEREFAEHHRQILEIFSAQVSMMLDNLRAREQILSLADTDDLTGIGNKRLFRRQLTQEIERARTYGVPLSLLLFDIDDFKQVNDTLGHTVGDVVLSELCGVVRETLRPPDTIARFGGDEFAVILPHTDINGARAVAERIIKTVRELTIPADDEGMVTCAISIGVAEYSLDDDAGMTDFVRRADERLYESKRQGKNRYTS
ncbi:MAG TPA: GGDEF domain-containing protein [Thermoanaerobaculia bacterium]|nr:GGDEF domain-containing protein [Thermoanaerobaculia bacterium]